jgi:hypothetical protein
MVRIVIPSDRRGACRPGILSVLLALVILTLSGPARSELRPLVREMLENLASLNQIGEAVALEDFERVKRPSPQRPTARTEPPSSWPCSG